MILKKKAIKGNIKFTRIPYHRSYFGASICDVCTYNDLIDNSVCGNECSYIRNTTNFGYIVKEKIDQT